jgi:hypothetical protein
MMQSFINLGIVLLPIWIMLLALIIEEIVK